MSTMAATDRPRRARRQFTDEFKAGAVGLVLDAGRTVGQVARELDLTDSALRNWVERERANRTQGRTAPAYTDPAIAPGAVTIRAVHLTELRAAVVKLEQVTP